MGLVDEVAVQFLISNFASQLRGQKVCLKYIVGYTEPRTAFLV